MTDKRIAMTFPENIWGRLATIAEDRGVTVAQVISGAVTNELKPRDRRLWVLSLVRNGYPDRAVAEITGELKSYVGDVRRRAGIKANRDRANEKARG